MKAPAVKKSKAKAIEPTGVAEIDRLQELENPSIDDYIAGVSAYVRNSSKLKAGPKKSGQIRLSNALGRALVLDLKKHLPGLNGFVGERKVSGGLRSGNADVTEIHELDGLRLAIELKPINLAVGRAIWNRFGDLRTFAVNLHLKFPFAVVGGVLVIPTYEVAGTEEAVDAEEREALTEEMGASEVTMLSGEGTVSVPEHVVPSRRKSTVHLINRAVSRLVRAGGRKTEADAAHLIEGIAVIVYDPDTAEMSKSVPEPASGLQWDDFILSLAQAYKARFED